MKFCEAMEKLKDGAKVTRLPWKDGVYFIMDGSDVKSFQPRLTTFVYNEDIMVSDGWIISGVADEMKFCDIISYLKNGGRARRADWKNAYIYFDRPSKTLVYFSMETFPYIPDFESFIAEDWIEL